MFTPRVSPIHRNLATSYVLLDALIDDLCLGGFSGIVELSLRDADFRIIISRGQVTATADSAGEDCGPKLIPELAARGRQERGLISIYRCSDESARSLAGRIRSKVVYSRLSTEFADLDKMISKLRRETDREWFVDVETESNMSGLIYINQTGVHAIASSPDAPDGEAALAKILEQCNVSGATFSVYYRVPGEPVQPEPESRAAQPLAAEILEPIQTLPEMDIPATRQLSPELQQEYFARAAAESLHHAGAAAGPASLDIQSLSQEPSSRTISEMDLGHAAPVDLEGIEFLERHPVVQAGAANGPAHDARQMTGPGDTSTIGPIGFGGSTDEAEAMPEVKRLMAEIASTIEKTAREIEPRDTFSIYLRAGQLKIADRYPFLDPFGSEFEYHAGEIAFIGKEGPSVFVQGLTEALQLAVRSVVEASSQPERLRSRIQEGLQEMTERLRPELESFGLQSAIHQITS